MPSIVPQLGGEAGVRQTMGLMVQLSNQASLDPVVRAQAASAIRGCAKGDWRCQVHSLLSWVSRKMQFIADPSTAEALHNPAMIARAIQERRFVYGDCDDFSMYLAALMKSVGFTPSFRAVGYDRGPLQHVYVSFRGLQLDATRNAWAEPIALPRTETSGIEVG